MSNEVRAHIAKKGNRYFVVAYGGINRATGGEKRDWSDGFATRKEAEREAATIEKRKEDGDYRSPDRIALSDYLNDRWLPLKKSQLSGSPNFMRIRVVAVQVVDVGRPRLHDRVADADRIQRTNRIAVEVHAGALRRPIGVAVDEGGAQPFSERRDQPSDATPDEDEVDLSHQSAASPSGVFQAS